MIPQFRVSVRISVDLTKVRPIPWDIIHTKDGLVSNHDYSYMKGIGWKAYKLLSTIEGKAIAFIDSQTKTHEEFEELADKLITDPQWSELNKLQGLDLGIASVVFALYAFGCFPITSCRGHPPPTAGARHPLVVFYARPERAPLIVGVAGGSGVGICNEWADSEGALMVFGTNIIDMRKFAIGLHHAFPAVSASVALKGQFASKSAKNTQPCTQPNNITKLDHWLV